jgi:anthranilate synthase component 1
MDSNILRVDVIRQEERQTNDALGVYTHALAHLDRHSVFILESLSGPSRDRRATIIGMEPLFEVCIDDERHARLRGRPELCQHLYSCLRQQGMRIGPEQQIELPDSESAWHLLRYIQNLFQGAPDKPQSLAYFGYFSYDSVRLIERLPDLAEQTHDYPLIALSVYQTLVYFHSNGTVETLINNHALWGTRDLEHYPFLRASNPVSLQEQLHYPQVFEEVRTVTPEQFAQRVEVAMEHIRAGDVYQIQLGHEIRIRSRITPLDVYKSLRMRNPSPYMYLAHVGGIDLVGASPELFVRIKDNLIEMRPIAGTVGKRPGVDPTELVLELTRSEKERAEHLMLIDLCRNDIGRVCQPGSLEVDEFMLVEEYSHLYHMVSNVRGLLRPGMDAYDVIKASFPAGTMSGAPKVRAMELIEAMESNRRGIYAGALGLIGFDGSVNTALCIRSTVHDQGTYYLRASAGVVADSTPQMEWKETLYKMGSVYRAVTGMEIAL